MGFALPIIMSWGFGSLSRNRIWSTPYLWSIKQIQGLLVIEILAKSLSASDVAQSDQCMQAGELMKWLWWASTMLMLAGCAGTPFSFEDKNAVAPLSGTVLITEDGKCPGEGEASQTVAKGPALGMSECQVVTVLGQADKIELAANERGDRTAVLTYTKGERPGIYRFVAGYLTAIERGAEPPGPTKPDRQRRKA